MQYIMVALSRKRKEKAGGLKMSPYFIHSVTTKRGEVIIVIKSYDNDEYEKIVSLSANDVYNLKGV